MALRKRATQVIVAAAIAATALTSVGLTASLDGPFWVRIRPVLLRIDAAALAESRASALGVDVDVRLGPLHMHFAWSAIPLFPASTKAETDKL